MRCVCIIIAPVILEMFKRSFLLKNALEFDALCQVWMKFAQLFSRRRIFILKCEKFTDKNNFCNEFTVGTAPIPFLVKQQKNNTGPNRHNHYNPFLRRR